MIGVVTGTGTYALPDFEDAEPVEVGTRWGKATVMRGHFGGVPVLHVSRHGAGHVRLSNHVEHRRRIGRRSANDVQDVGCRGLPLQCLGKIGGAALDPRAGRNHEDVHLAVSEHDLIAEALEAVAILHVACDAQGPRTKGFPLPGRGVDLGLVARTGNGDGA